MHLSSIYLTTTCCEAKFSIMFHQSCYCALLSVDTWGHQRLDFHENQVERGLQIYAHRDIHFGMPLSLEALD